MPHVDAPGRIGEHLEDIGFGPVASPLAVVGGKAVRGVPRRLPAGIGSQGAKARFAGHSCFTLSFCSAARARRPISRRSEEHTSELPSLMRISSAGLCLKQKNN